MSRILRPAWFFVLAAALLIGGWSMYHLLYARMGLPEWVAVISALVFDVSALIFSEYARAAVDRRTGVMVPAVFMLGCVGVSSYANYSHGVSLGWGTTGGVVLGAIPVLLEALFTAHVVDTRGAHRADTMPAPAPLPRVGVLPWLLYLPDTFKAMRRAVWNRLETSQAVNVLTPGQPMGAHLAPAADNTPRYEIMTTAGPIRVRHLDTILDLQRAGILPDRDAPAVKAIASPTTASPTTAWPTSAAGGQTEVPAQRARARRVARRTHRVARPVPAEAAPEVPAQTTAPRNPREGYAKTPQFARAGNLSSQVNGRAVPAFARPVPADAPGKVNGHTPEAPAADAGLPAVARPVPARTVPVPAPAAAAPEVAREAVEDARPGTGKRRRALSIAAAVREVREAGVTDRDVITTAVMGKLPAADVKSVRREVRRQTDNSGAPVAVSAYGQYL